MEKVKKIERGSMSIFEGSMVEVKVDQRDTIYADNLGYSDLEGALGIVEYLLPCTAYVYIFFHPTNPELVGKRETVHHSDISMSFDRELDRVAQQQVITFVNYTEKQIYWTPDPSLITSIDEYFKVYHIKSTKRFHQRNIGEYLDKEELSDFLVRKAEDIEEFTTFHTERLKYDNKE